MLRLINLASKKRFPPARERGEVCERSLPSQGTEYCRFKLLAPGTVKCAWKNDGYTFLVAIFLSTIILGIGLGASQMILKELNFSNDLLFGEQSYYAAESGVEVALMDLQVSPVQHVENDIANKVDVGLGEFIPSINNRLEAGDSFPFTLPPLASLRFRLLQDNDASRAPDPRPSDNFNLNVSPAGAANEFQWKVLCESILTGNTVSLQDALPATIYPNFLANAIGKNDSGGSETYLNWRNDVVRDSCYFSVQSLASGLNLDFNITANADLAPPVSRVTSVGRAGNRQKTIDFNYSQESLSSLFDFVFFHSEAEAPPTPPTP